MRKKLIKELFNIFQRNGHDLYIVGGAIRDELMGLTPTDYDLVTSASNDEINILFDKVDNSYSKYGVSIINYKGIYFEVTTLRKEEYSECRKPSKITFVKSPIEDSFRRDFTINALYKDCDDNILDFHHGREDLNNKLIRIIGDADKRFKEDPLRILRCLRFSMQLNFSIEENTSIAIKNNLSLLKKLSIELVNKEIEKMKNINKEKYLKLEKIYELSNYVVTSGNNKRNIIDLHCDSLTVFNDKNVMNNDLHIDINKLYKGEYLMQCFAIFLYYSKGDLFDKFNYYADRFDSMILENNSYLHKVTNYQDLMIAKSLNKIGAMLTVEEGGIIEGDINKLVHLYNRGVRMITLTWNFVNEIASPNINSLEKIPFEKRVPNVKDGLTPFGIEVIKKMNELGMIIDVSHLSDKGFYDVIKYSSQPIVASHSCSRKVHGVVRNLTDEMMLELKNNGGVVGINYCPDFVSNNQNNNQIEDIVDHIEHFISIGCIDNIALGSDFDGIRTPNGLSDASKLPLLREALLKRGLTENQINKIFYKNFIRVMKKVLK